MEEEGFVYQQSLEHEGFFCLGWEIPNATFCVSSLSAGDQFLTPARYRISRMQVH
jgi:hypothetical protein